MRRGQQGERGKTGDHGQVGDTGPRGLAGRSITLWQALSMFLLITLIGFVLAWRAETHDDQIEAQQRAIAVNTQQIADGHRRTCLDNRKILEGFNRQQDRLADIERDLRDNPDASPAGKKAATERIAAYQAGKIDPFPPCPGD